MNKFWDVMVIGGGPAGSTAAYLLASRGYSVILLEKRLFPRPKLCAGLLTWKTIELIHSIFDFSVKDLIELGLIIHQTRDYRIFCGTTEMVKSRLDYPFHFIERLTYDHFLLQQAIQAGAHVITGQAVRHVDPEAGCATLSIGTRLRARLIIGADGAWSVARRSVFCSPNSKSRWHHQLAMTIESRLPYTSTHLVQNCAALHFGFVPWGYAWSFPNRGYRIVGVAGLGHKDDQPLVAGFDRFLASIGVRRRELRIPRAHPLPMGNYLDPPGRGRLLLVGDACGLADPLLGEGIYYAHRSAEIAARSIMSSDSGDKDPLREYQRALSDRVLGELRWIKVLRNLIFMGGRKRKFRGLKLLLSIMPKRVEAAVQGQISFAGLLWPGLRPPLQEARGNKNVNDS